ncbi:MAG TPA: VOC family protein [Pseudonocardiaceae bacterium]|nr:VOC family protein [Pseudonocardiaceae bacterium]
MHWSHVGLNCRDPRVTEEFYTRWFGFTRARTIPLADGEIRFLRNGDAYLELFPAQGDGTPNTQDGPPTAGTVRHVAFQTDDIDRLLDRMGGAADVTLGPLDFSDFIDGWRTVWLHDPDGVVVEVSQGYRDAAVDGRPV